jgi:hypothetical protein
MWRGKQIGAVCGLAAAVSMIALTIASSDSGRRAEHVLAGSGEGSASGMYTQPAISGMTVGATATFSTPAGRPAVESAAPNVKARG